MPSHSACFYGAFAACTLLKDNYPNDFDNSGAFYRAAIMAKKKVVTHHCLANFYRLSLGCASSDPTVQTDDLTTYIPSGASQLVCHESDEWSRNQGKQPNQDCDDVIPAGVCTDG